MHCPRCGQEQVSEDIKFCSRCGFPLGLVSELLAHGGFLPQLAELYKKDKPRITKKHGVLFSIFWFMFFVLILTPFWGIMDIDELAGICSIIGIFGGLMILIAALTLLKSEPKAVDLPMSELQKANMHNLHGANKTALPPSVETYVSPAGSWKAPNTGELVSPGSVVEGTTKLLQKDK